MATSHGVGAVCLFDALPVAVLRRILGALPVDSRGRACAVCRAWRDVLADAALWEVLDLTRAGGVPPRLVTANLAHGAAARAAGQLRFLNLGGINNLSVLENHLVDANGASLRELHCHGLPLSVAAVRALLADAPHLELLHAAVECDASDAGALLRNEPPYGPMRAHQVEIRCGDAHTGVLLEVAAAVAAHSHIWGLEVNIGHMVDDPAVLDAFMDAARRGRIPSCCLEISRFRPGNDRALARLLQSDTLTSLHVGLDWDEEDGEAGIELLAAALHGAVYLEHFSLNAHLWDYDNYGVMMTAIDRALPALKVLRLSFNSATYLDKGAIGRALGALLVSDRPCLHTLEVEYCDLNDEGVVYLLAGLAANTHLGTLRCMGNNLSEAFEREMLTPVLEALAARSAEEL